MSPDYKYKMDTLIMYSLLDDGKLIKNAGFVMDVIEKVKDHFKIDPNHKVRDLTNALAPTAIQLIFAGLGMPWIGLGLGTLAEYFQFDIGSAVEKMLGTLMPHVEANNPVSYDQVRAAATSAVSSGIKPLSPEQEAEVAVKLESAKSASSMMHDIKFIKLAVETGYYKKAGILTGAVSWIGKKLFPFIITALTWIFFTALKSAGMIAGAKAIESTFGHADGAKAKQPSNRVKSTQDKFKIKSTYNESERFNDSSRVVNFPNNPAGIANMLVAFTKEVYEGTDNLDSIIRSAPGFQPVVDTLVYSNYSSQGDPFLFIPKTFDSKKDIVDYFVDDIAKKAP